MQNQQLIAIARYRGSFGSKFGVPKQSGLVDSVRGQVVLEPQYSHPDYVRELDTFSHIWLLWAFSANPHEATSALVRPPLLGGNAKVGVFASRSPFRPNAIGLSSVRLLGISETKEGRIALDVAGADLMDGTPIYDIKPYVKLSDCHTDAVCGFTESTKIKYLKVELSEELAHRLTPEQAEALRGALSLDPRPHYKADGDKTYGFPYAGMDIKFTVSEGTAKAFLAEPLTQTGETIFSKCHLETDKVPL